MKRLPTVAFVLFLAGCNVSAFSEITSSERVPLSSKQVDQVQRVVTQDFFDPDSALFRNIRAVDVSLANGTRETRVCGEVNGKNRLGGYVGYSAFGGKLVNGVYVKTDFFSPCENW